jgi:phenylalanyl-tRNA synthetase beta chain
MKVSLSWIFDHIQGSMQKVDVSDLVKRFNESVAEIEGYYTWGLSSDLHFVRIIGKNTTFCKIQFLHTQKTSDLPCRNDLIPGDIVLVYDKELLRWACMNDLGGGKETMLPPIDPRCTTWDALEQSDIILEIDNKSITHRPDLWSHRGLAREVAALLGLALTKEEELFAQVPVHRSFGLHTEKNIQPQLILEKDVPCRRLAAAYLSTTWHPSLLPMLIRLCRVDMRPIDALVDTTNYVMLDYGQPMHAFDATTLDGSTVYVRYAQTGETCTMLDGDTITLHAQDMVLADARTVISLPGVMGGRYTGVSRSTRQLLLEAGSFEPIAIRRTAARYLKRTEAAMRFEKNLDPEMPVYALKRFMALLANYEILYQPNTRIVECGPKVESTIISLLHSIIESRLGLHINPSKICLILEALSFKVSQAVIDGGQGYIITVPSFRATKDVTIPEDIIEEIGRYIGYQHIPTQLPRIVPQASVAHIVYRLRTLKKYCASALHMREISSYAFYDESWLSYIKWQPAFAIEALNPVSHNWKRLVTSLIPGLLKAVHENYEGTSDISYFEVGRTWIHQSPVLEQKQIAGVMYTKASATDFYTLKEYVQLLCAQIGITVTWRRPDVTETLAAWYDPYCVARCVYEDTVVGTVGLVTQAWKDRLVQSGFLGIFELDSNLLCTTSVPIKKYTPLPKYPDIVRDISVRISHAIPALQIQEQIQAVDTRIHTVTLVDFFKKAEWVDTLSLTFRYIIRDNTKTLTTQEADAVSHTVTKLLISLGGDIR